MTPTKPVTLGEFVVVSDGRSGVLVAPRPKVGELAIWFGDTLGDSPVVEIFEPEHVWRWDGQTDAPVYYH